MDLKPGDVVVLKSGGHPITVAEVDGEGVICLWMGDRGELFREAFPLVALERVESEDEEEEESEDE